MGGPSPPYEARNWEEIAMKSVTELMGMVVGIATVIACDGEQPSSVKGDAECPCSVEETVAIEEPIAVDGTVSVAGTVVVEEPVTVEGTVDCAVEEPVTVEGTVDCAIEEPIAVEEPVTVEGTVSLPEPLQVIGTIDVGAMPAVSVANHPANATLVGLLLAGEATYESVSVRSGTQTPLPAGKLFLTRLTCRGDSTEYQPWIRIEGGGIYTLVSRPTMNSFGVAEQDFAWPMFFDNSDETLVIYARGAACTVFLVATQ
jgi:hypothetical protein